MRTLLATPLLALLFLGGCTQPQYLLTEHTETPVAGAQRISLNIANDFSADERRGIIAGIGDWNRSRSGDGRFDIDILTEGTRQPGGWTITQPSGLDLAPSDEWRPEPRAITRRFANGGGSIVVFPNRLGTHSLRGVVANELEGTFSGG
jgi:hypothetical protein